MPLYSIRLDVARSDGPFYILGAADAALQAAGMSVADRDRFTAEATAGDFEELYQTARRWFDTSTRKRKGA